MVKRKLIRLLKMDDTYDTHIAQGGTNVSGGQKQRLAIARAIARNPEIYIFDDSFSANFLLHSSVLQNLTVLTDKYHKHNILRQLLSTRSYSHSPHVFPHICNPCAAALLQDFTIYLQPLYLSFPLFQIHPQNLHNICF